MYKTLYHGSSRLFDTFSLDFIGENGRAQGVGVYLTPKRMIAQDYAKNGYLYSVTVTLENELSQTKRTLTLDQIRHILEDLYAIPDLELLSNYGDIQFEGTESVLWSAIQLLDLNTNDLDIYNELITTCGDVDAVRAVFYTLNHYTHTIADDYASAHVIFDPKHIQIRHIEAIH